MPAELVHTETAFMTEILSLAGVSFSYGQESVLEQVDLSVKAGTFVSVVGPSGCGKTTLLKIIGGISRPTSGQVMVGDTSATQALARRELGFVFQQPTLLPWRTARANVALPLEVAGAKHTAAAANALLSRVRLEGYENHYPHQLSGGQAQRVAIARAFAHRPKLLLLDEPFSALDEITRNELHIELLRTRAKDQPTPLTTTVFVTHSITEAVFLSDRVIVLSPRPAQVVADITIDMPRPRVSDDIRYSLHFNHLVQCIRDSLRAA